MLLAAFGAFPDTLPCSALNRVWKNCCLFAFLAVEFRKMLKTCPGRVWHLTGRGRVRSGAATCACSRRLNVPRSTRVSAAVQLQLQLQQLQRNIEAVVEVEVVCLLAARTSHSGLRLLDGSYCWLSVYHQYVLVQSAWPFHRMDYILSSFQTVPAKSLDLAVCSTQWRRQRGLAKGPASNFNFWLKIDVNDSGK